LGGAVSGHCRKQWSGSGRLRSWNGAGRGGYKNRLECGAAFSLLTLRSCSGHTLRHRKCRSELAPNPCPKELWTLRQLVISPTGPFAYYLDILLTSPNLRCGFDTSKTFRSTVSYKK